MSHSLIRILAVLAFCATAPSIPSAEVYRCTEGGKTVYSDRPCQGGAGSTVTVPPASSANPGATNRQLDANMGRIAIGQTPLQVETAWGRPRARNVDTASSGRTEQWVYERADGTFYVYFSSGVVASYSQQSELSSASKTDALPPVEPTQAEIDAQIRATKAGERRFIRERTPMSEVVKRIGEPDSKVPVGAAECWYYSATRLDPQTNTKICFTVSGYVFDVERLVAR